MIKLLFFSAMLPWIAILCNAQSSSQQSQKLKYQMFKFKLECPMYSCDINGRIIDSTQIISEIDSKFILVFAESDYCIIRFLPKNKRENRRLNLKAKKKKDSVEYFLVKKIQFDFKVEEANFREWNLTVGNVITPIKLRMRPFVFNKDFSLGPTFGIKYKPSRYSIGSFNLLLGMGVLSVTLDSFNTKGHLRKSQEQLAFTPSLGAMLEVRNSQFGIFSGIDLLSKSSDITRHFIYRRSLWVSVGFGYSLFSTQ